MCRRRRARASLHGGQRGAPRRFFRDRFPSSPAKTYSRRRRSSSPPAACPSPKWARQVSATTSPASFRFPSSLAVRRWFRLRSPARSLRNFARLAGVSAPVVAACGKRSFREKMLFTHRGLSGPAILQISSYWKKPDLPSRIDSHRLVARTATARAVARAECAARSGCAESGAACASAGSPGRQFNRPSA